MVWEEEDIGKMPGTGGKKGKLLVSAGITKVNQLKIQTEDSSPNYGIPIPLKEHAHTIRKITEHIPIPIWLNTEKMSGVTR